MVLLSFLLRTPPTLHIKLVGGGRHEAQIIKYIGWDAHPFACANRYFGNLAREGIGYPLGVPVSYAHVYLHAASYCEHQSLTILWHLAFIFMKEQSVSEPSVH